jgi:plasmid maintenance system antidote protein VapI
MTGNPIHPGEYLADELKARGWSTADLAERMGGDVDFNQCCVDLLMSVRDPNLMMGAEVAAKLGQALGTSAEMWINLDRAYRLGPHPL